VRQSRIFDIGQLCHDLDPSLSEKWNHLKNHTDSCNTVYDAVVSINAGEIWDDVLESVGDKYHVVTGGGRSVGTIGGWLQGGGMSFSSRNHGLGVEQVVDLRVVLANGTIVTADACTNSDLFWA